MWVLCLINAYLQCPYFQGYKLAQMERKNVFLKFKIINGKYVIVW